MRLHAMIAVVALIATTTYSRAGVTHGNIDITTLNGTNLNQDSPDPAVSSTFSRLAGQAKILKQTNKGDYHIEFESAGTDDQTLGVLLSNVSVLEDDYSATIIPLDPGNTHAVPGPNYPISTTAYNGSFQNSGSNSDGAGSFFLSVNNAAGSTVVSSTGSAGQEYNSDVEFAFFTYDSYLAGFADTRGGLNDGSRSDPTDFLFGSSTTGIALVTAADVQAKPNPADFIDTTGGVATGRTGSEFIDVSSTGEFLLDLTSRVAPTAPDQGVFATNQNGVLLAVNGGNSNEFVTTRANPDGSFSLFNFDDAGATANTLNQNPVAFSYIPLGDSATAAVGRVDAEGDTLIGSGSFSVTKLTMLDSESVDGTYLLEIADQSLDTGTLLVTPESDGSTASSQFLMQEYREDLGGWVIQSRAVPTAALTDLLTDSAAFSFAFYKVPEPSSVALVACAAIVGLVLSRKR